MKNEHLDYLFRSLKHHPSPYIIYDLDGSIRWINLAGEYIFRTEDISEIGIKKINLEENEGSKDLIAQSYSTPVEVRLREIEFFMKTRVHLIPSESSKDFMLVEVLCNSRLGLEALRQTISCIEYDRIDLAYQKQYDLKTGEITDRYTGIPGEERTICPWIGGVRGWVVGSYTPKTQLWYTMAQDYCNIIEVVEGVERIQGNLGWNAMVTAVVHKDNPAPRLVAVDPATGKIAWQQEFDAPNFGAVLTTAGGLLFYGTSFGAVHALDIEDGSTLWSFNTGSGNRAGVISYEAKGEQFILFPTGCCGAVPGMFMPNIDPRFADINEGAMIVSFKVPK